MPLGGRMTATSISSLLIMPCMSPYHGTLNFSPKARARSSAASQTATSFAPAIWLRPRSSACLLAIRPQPIRANLSTPPPNTLAIHRYFDQHERPLRSPRDRPRRYAGNDGPRRHVRDDHGPQSNEGTGPHPHTFAQANTRAYVTVLTDPDASGNRYVRTNERMVAQMRLMRDHGVRQDDAMVANRSTLADECPGHDQSIHPDMRVFRDAGRRVHDRDHNVR